MCLSSPSPPPPPPLAPPPPPPAPPRAPIPEPEPVEREVNPTVQNPQSDKDKNPYATGTEQLTINQPPTTNNPGTEGSSTGTNV